MRFLINAAILIVPLVWLSWGAYSLTTRIVRWLNTDARLAAIASAEASRALNRVVKVRDVHITGNLFSLLSTNRIELKDVFVSEASPYTSRPFVTADRIVLSYSLHSIIYGDAETPYCRNLEVVRPRVEVLRDQRGRWNFADLERPTGAEGRNFTDMVTVVEGSFVLRDDDFRKTDRSGSTELFTKLTGVSGLASIRSDKTVSFSCTCITDPHLARKLQVEGVLAKHLVGSTAHVMVEGLNLQALTDQFVPNSEMRLSSGTADIDLNAVLPQQPYRPSKQPPWNSALISGSVHVQGLSGKTSLLDAPLVGTDAHLDFTNETCSLTVAGVLGGTPVTASASLYSLPNIMQLSTVAVADYQKQLLTHSSRPTTMCLEVNVPQSDLNALYRALRIEKVLPPLPDEITNSIRHTKALGTVHARMEGELTDPVGVASGHLVVGQYDNIKGKNLDVSVSYLNRVLTADAHGDYAGGQAEVRTRITLGQIAPFSLYAHGRNLRLPLIGWDLGTFKDGNGDIDLAMIGRRGRTPAITAQVQVNDLKLNNRVFQHAYCRAEAVARKLYIRALRVDDRKGFALGSGSIDLITRAISANVEADGLDIHSITEAIETTPPIAADPNVPSLENIEGTAYLRKGKLSGTLDDPVLSGEVVGFGLSTGKYEADRAVAAFRLSGAGLVISRGSLERYPSLVEFAGSVADFDQPDPSFDFNVQVTDLDLKYVADLVGIDSKNYLVDGTVSTDDPAGLRIVGRNGALRVEALGSTVANKPFAVSLRRASVNALKMPQASAELYYDQDGLHLHDSKIDVAGGSIKVTGTLGPNGELSGIVNAHSMNIAELSSVSPGYAEPELDGKITLAAHIGGTLQDPTVALDSLSAIGLVYHDLHIGDVTAAGEYKAGVVSLRALSLTDAESGKQVVRASEIHYDRQTGKISSPDAGAVDAIQIVDLPIARVGSFWRTLHSADDSATLPLWFSEIHGGLAGSISVSGTLDEPEANILLKSRDIALREYHADAVSGSISLSRHGISGSDLLVSVTPGSSAPGSTAPGTLAPVQSGQDDATVSVRQFKLLYGGELSADIDITNLNLAFIQSAVEPAAMYPIGGKCDKVGLLVGGTIQSPQIDFSVNLSNVSYMNRTFERVELDHGHIEEGEIQIDQVRLTKLDTLKNAYQATASGVVRGFTWSAPFLPDTAALDITAEVPRDAKLNKQVDLKLLGELGFAQFKDSVGSFGGYIRVSGALSAPRITSGAISVSVDKYRFPGFQTGLLDIKAKLKIENDVLSVEKDGFTAHTLVYDRKGIALPKTIGEPIRLTGSIPIGYGDAAPPAVANPLTLTAAKIPFEEKPLPGTRTGGISGDAALNITVTRSLLHPVIGGTINFTNTLASLPSDFTPPSSSSVLPIINPRLDLTINLTGKNVRLKNPELDAHVGGFISLRGDVASPIIHGRIALNQGYLTVPPRRFDLMPPGSIEIDYGSTAVAASGLSVRINIKARTKLTAVSIAGVRKLYTITVSADGPLTDSTVDPITGQSRMHLDFTTDPNDLAINQQALSERLVTSLFGVDTFNSVGQNPGQTAVTAFTNIFTGYVLPSQFDKMSTVLGLEQLGFSYDPIQQLAVMVSRQLVGPVYLTYNRGLNAENRYYDVKFSLRFRGRYQLSYDFDDQQTQQFLLEGVWRY